MIRRAGVLAIAASLFAASGVGAQTERPTRPPEYTRPPAPTRPSVTRPPFTRPPETRPPGRTREPSQTRPPRRSPESLDALKRRALAAIDRRIATLDELLQKMGTARRLRDEHRNALQEQIDAAKSGLRELRARIEASTDVEMLRAEMRSIARDHRIYLLVAPKVHLLLSVDRVLAAAALLETLAGKLQGTLDQQGGASEARTALDSMRTHIAAARNAVDGVAEKVIPLKASDFPGNRSELQAARESIATARQELSLARDDGRRAVSSLRSPAPSPSPTAT